MSADNWAVCPRCSERRAEHLRSLDIDIANAYGTISVEEFDEMRSARDLEAAREIEPTFREDFEIWGIEDGEFNVSYSGGCRECGLKHTFKHSETVEVQP